MSKRSKHVVNLFTIACIPLVCCGPDAADEDQSAKLLIEHARLIDGSGGPPAENISILISAGTIVRIGHQIVAPEAKKLDASGLTVLPGIVDSHVHVSSVPGSGFRDDSREVLEALQRHHLSAYLACGVTTVLDTAIPVDEARKIQAWLQSGHPGPRLLVLSPTFTSPLGYLSNDRLGPGLFFSPVSSIAEVEQRFRQSEELDAAGVKVVLESGFGFGELPIHSDQIREAIRQEASRRDLPLYVHSTAESDQHVAIEMGAHAHVHGATFGSDDVVKRLEQTSHLITTLSIQDAWTIAKDPSRLDQPLYQSTVPLIELETARSADAWMNLSKRFASMVLPDTATEHQIADFAKAGDPSDTLSRWLANVGKLRAAGATIVMGSDSGNWPIMPHMFHGPTSIREIELLGMAGLSRMEAIRAATSVPAAMLGLDGEIGSVAVGRRADLIIVAEDPLEDLRALRSIQWTIKDGVAKSPTEWLATQN